jgi:hypothetical protein
MKTFHFLIRFCALTLLTGVGGTAFANSWVPVVVNNSDAGESDLPGYSQGAVIKSPFRWGYDGSFFGTTFFPDERDGYYLAGPRPEACVQVWTDPNTGEGYTGSPLYITGTYALIDGNTGGGLSWIMITVIAPDGTQNVQTLNLSGDNNGWYMPGLDYHTYQWTIPVLFSNPGTYQVLAAMWVDIAGSYAGAAWYQDDYTYSYDGVNWGPGIYSPNSNTRYFPVQPWLQGWYSQNDISWSDLIGWGAWSGPYTLGTSPMTSGTGNEISFTVVTNPDPGHVNQVYTEMEPIPALSLWYRSSDQVSKTFTIQSPVPNNVVPGGGPIYPPPPNLF